MLAMQVNSTKIPDLKRCNHCKQHKSLDEFARLTNGEYGRQKRCRACQRIMVKGCPSTHGKKKRLKHLKYFYGMTQEQLEGLLESQNGQCAICGCTEESHRMNSGRFLYVDHCHATGTIRGLLCARCNTGLGAFADNPEFLRLAAAYLESRSESALSG